MLALVVYESVHGATACAARVIAERLQSSGVFVELRHLPDLAPAAAAAADLLVVGGPTHLHGTGWTITRRMIADATSVQATVGPGLRAWFHRLPEVRGPRAAAFDVRREGLDPAAGTAAGQIATRLRRRGFLVVEEPVGFLVSPDHHLLPGELDRAAEWAGRLSATLHGSAV